MPRKKKGVGSKGALAMKEKLRKKMSQNGLEEIRFNFDFQGTQIVLS